MDGVKNLDVWIDEWLERADVGLGWDAAKWESIFDSIWAKAKRELDEEVEKWGLTEREKAQVLPQVLSSAMSAATMNYAQVPTQAAALITSAINDFYTEEKRRVMIQTREDNLMLKTLEFTDNKTTMALTASLKPDLGDLKNSRILTEELLKRMGFAKTKRPNGFVDEWSNAQGNGPWTDSTKGGNYTKI
ncbi:MAG: hypothetical protein LBU73_05065 [Helicobacteraceae bacterium]|jgi:hypothetical protein|nr:hypothetical protein [Helicobacteraceae bacterium]